MVDNFPMFIKVYTLKDRTAITASRYDYDNCLVYDIPEKIYSSQDPALEANLFNQLMEQLVINPEEQVHCTKKWSFPLRISSVMWPNPQEAADLPTFTEEILNGKLHFLCSGCSSKENGLHEKSNRIVKGFSLKYATFFEGNGTNSWEN